MRGGWIALALGITMSLAAGCSGGGASPQPVDPADVYTVDFIGELVAADTSRWEQAQSDQAREAFAAASGGPDSPLLVGPATLTLDDGTMVDVAPRTRGGTFCPQLDLFNEPPDPPPGLDERQACIVLGVFVPGTTTADWFATEIVARRPDGFAMTAVFMNGQALVNAGWGARFAVPVSPDVTIGCGMRFADVLAEPTMGYSVTITPDRQVTDIECLSKN